MTSKPDDVSSDPSLGDGEGTDWASEGGGLPEGPATDPEADDAGSGDATTPD